MLTKKKSRSRRRSQKLEGRCSWKNVCHRKCCSVISSHCFQLYTFQGGSSMIVHTYIDVRENLHVGRVFSMDPCNNELACDMYLKDVVFPHLYLSIVQVDGGEHKRAPLPRTNNSTTIVHFKLGPTLIRTLTLTLTLTLILTLKLTLILITPPSFISN